VHLSTLRADGSPRNWVVWVGLEGEHILVCTSDAIWKAKDMRRDPRVPLSVTDIENPYRMAAIQGRVVEVRGLPLHGPDLLQVHGRAVSDPGARPRVLRDRGRAGGAADARLRPQPELTTGFTFP
jgi:Pyridoxamine 5'-phosphate oxidase